VPGPEKHLLINLFGLHYTVICASNLVKIELEENILCDSRYPINPAGLVPHSAVHLRCDHAHCMMHTHTTAGLAVVCTKRGLSMRSFYAAQLHGKVAYHDFEGISTNPEEGPRACSTA
jgi:ribulose-5-phosphate 4-epimerase/fuculose-1-phosphate aldolase